MYIYRCWYMYMYICAMPNFCNILLFCFISLISVHKKCYSCHQLSTDLQRYYWKSGELGSCMSFLCTNDQHTCTKYNVSFYCYCVYMCITDFFWYKNYFCMSCWLYYIDIPYSFRLRKMVSCLCLLLGKRKKLNKCIAMEKFRFIWTEMWFLCSRIRSGFQFHYKISSWRLSLNSLFITY